MSGKIVKRKDFEKGLDLNQQVSMEESGAVRIPSSERRVISKEVYEATSEAQKIIDEARAEAHKIKKEAEEILKRVQEEMEKAKKRGLAEGKEEGLAQVSELLISATHAKEKMFEDVERDAVGLVYDIAEKIIGSELAERETAIVDLIRQALHTAIGRTILILVNPQNIEVVKKHHPNLMQILDASKTIQIRADEKVAPKGCIIETDIGTIDAQLETQLGAIKKALGIEEEGEGSGDKGAEGREQRAGSRGQGAGSREQG